MPFGLPLSLTGSLRDDFVRGHRELGHLLSIADRSDFRITAEIPHQDDMVEHCRSPDGAGAPEGQPRRCAHPTRAATVTGDQPPPTRCPAPSPEQPQRTFLAGPLTPAEGPDRKARCRNARSATSVWS